MKVHSATRCGDDKMKDTKTHFKLQKTQKGIKGRDAWGMEGGGHVICLLFREVNMKKSEPMKISDKGD